jgi:hypothetical protein
VETRRVRISRLFRGQSPWCLPFPTVEGYLFRGVPSRRADSDWRGLLVGGQKRQYRHETRVVYACHSWREEAIPRRNDIPLNHSYLCFITPNVTLACGSETAKAPQLVPHCAPTTYVPRVGTAEAVIHRQGGLSRVARKEENIPATDSGWCPLLQEFGPNVLPGHRGS